MKPGFPWHLMVYSLLGAIILRPVFPDDIEYMGACLLYGVVLGLVFAVLDIRSKDE